MSITAEAIRLQHQLDAQVDKVADAQTRTLVAAWVAAWAEVSADLQDTLEELLGDGSVTRATMSRSLRLRGMLAQIADQLDTLAADAGVTITSDLDKVVRDAVRAQHAIVAAEMPHDVDLTSMLAPTLRGSRELDAIVRRSTERITARTRALSAPAQIAVRRELVRGVAVGSNPRKVAARMVERANGQFDGGLNRALVIARTEMVDAHRAAAEAEQNQQAGVLAGWIWLCHLSPRTCPSCLVKNGTLHPLSEAGPEDHPQGRCSRMPKTKSWADLGLDVDEPDDVVPDARTWFDALPEADQVAILGRRRLDLLNAGSITWEDLTSKRTADGWRDSWVVTPLAQLLGRSSAGRRRAS